MSEETPEFAKHVDDPTHPAGNPDLAYEMAHEGLENREAAYVQQKATVDAYQEAAERKEERARKDYLEMHPELSEGQETTAEVGGEDPASAVPLRGERDIDASDVEQAAEVGGVALNDEEQARIQAMNDNLNNDNDPEHPRGNVDMAHEMFNSQAAGEQVINNINGSDLPNKEELVKTIREKGEELAARAREEYLIKEKAYKLARDESLGKVLNVLSGALGEQPINVANYKVDAKNGSSDFYSEETAEHHLTPALLDRLKREIYIYLGAAPAEDSQFEDRDDNAKMIETKGNIDGTTIMETRWFTDYHNGNPKGQGLEHLQVWVEKKEEDEKTGVPSEQVAGPVYSAAPPHNG